MHEDEVLTNLGKDHLICLYVHNLWLCKIACISRSFENLDHFHCKRIKIKLYVQLCSFLYFFKSKWYVYHVEIQIIFKIYDGFSVGGVP